MDTSRVKGLITYSQPSSCRQATVAYKDFKAPLTARVSSICTRLMCPSPLFLASSPPAGTPPSASQCSSRVIKLLAAALAYLTASSVCFMCIVCVFVCVHVCMHVHVHGPVCACVVCVCVCVCVCMYVCMHMPHLSARNIHHAVIGNNKAS